MEDWREVMRELADEVEASIRERYEDGHGVVHPSYQRKFDRDMEIVRKARALTAEPTDRGIATHARALAFLADMRKPSEGEK